MLRVLDLESLAWTWMLDGIPLIKECGDAHLHKDWELGARKKQHEAEDTELEEAFQNLYLDEEEATGGGGEAVS